MRLREPSQHVNNFKPDSLYKGLVLFFCLANSMLAADYLISEITRDLGTQSADSSINYRWENTSWELSAKHIYLHDEFGQLTQDSRYFYSIDTWFNEYRNILSYDIQNNLVEWLNQEGNIFSWQNFWLDQYDYNSNGALVEKARQIYNNDSWQSLERINYSYDVDSLLSEEIIQVHVAGNWINDYRKIYTYLPDGQVVSTLRQSWDYDDGFWYNDSLNSFGYTENRRSSHLEQTWHDDEWHNQHQKTFDYDTDDHLIEAISKDWFVGQWLEVERQTYDFDLSGLLIKTTYQDWDYDETSWVDRDRQHFHFDEAGNLIESLTEFWDLESSDWAVEFLNTWYYPTPTALEIAQPREFRFDQNFPNPFNPATSIRFKIPEYSRVKLTIYDVRGSVIRTLYSGEKTAGFHEHIWGGLNDTGNPVSTGVYFCRLQVVDPARGGSGGFNQTIKMLYLK